MKKGKTQKQKLRREILLTWLAIDLSVILNAFLLWEFSRLFVRQIHQGELRSVVEIGLLMVMLPIFLYSSFVYQFTRLSYLKRRFAHQPASSEELDAIYEGEAPPLAVLVPSYKEEAKVIEQTLCSAALQAYPNRRVILLIDDPPQPTNLEDRIRLEAARKLPLKVQARLQNPRDRMEEARTDFLTRKSAGEINLAEETLRLSRLYGEVADWFDKQAFSYPTENHTDVLFREKVFLEPSRLYAQKAASLAALRQTLSGWLVEAQIEQEYRRLNCLFRVELTSFERKLYLNLSHRSNKAMNLNSYISLVGKGWREVERDGSLYLESVPWEKAELQIPDATYFITLDADSLLSHEYALRLAQVMNQPGNERVAIVQTPYTSIPNPPGVLERIAGATTDIQYIIHQGFTGYKATFWVGANALLRKSALEDICIIEEESGFPVAKYIQDRTVIEDTESTVDLIDRGWQLYNYPERLSYSATPPDFGSLLIQRRRWANGGLLILPKLLRYLLRQPPSRSQFAQGAMQVHYLTSITGVNFSLLILLLYPFDQDSIGHPLLLIAATVVYFFIQTRDLLQNGYHLLDIFRVYAINWLLLPVNLSGVFQSIHQGITGKKVPFARTPKISGKTGFSAFYPLAEFAMLLCCLIGLCFHVIHGRWLLFSFTLLNLIAITYALTCFIGLRDSISAIRLVNKRQQNS